MTTRSHEEDLIRLGGRLLVEDSAPEFVDLDTGLTNEFLRAHGIGPCLRDKARTDPAWRRFLPERGWEKKRDIGIEIVRQAEFASVVGTLRSQYPHHPPVIFKGQALAYLIYTKPWLRPRVDVDALVKQGQLTTVMQALSGLGYERVQAIDGDLVLRQASLVKREYEFSHAWDIHWSISNRPAFDNFLTYEYLLDTGIEVRAEDVTFVAPSLVNSLLIACLHLIGHHLHDTRLIWLYDIHLLADRLSESQRQEFLDMATNRPEVQSACHAALVLTQRYLPAEPTQILQASLDPGPRARITLRRFYITRLVDDFRALGKTDRRSFIRQHILPSGDYMMKRFGIKQRWQLPFWYLLRMARAVPKLLRKH